MSRSNLEKIFKFSEHSYNFNYKEFYIIKSHVALKVYIWFTEIF